MIFQNALKINGKFIVSTHRHECVGFKIGDFEGFLDGGAWPSNGYYSRSAVIPKELESNIENWTLTDKSTLQEILDKLLWGHYEKPNIKGKFLYSPMSSLSLEHLKAILKNVKNINSLHKFVIEYWIDQKYQKHLLL